MQPGFRGKNPFSIRQNSLCGPTTTSTEWLDSQASSMSNTGIVERHRARRIPHCPESDLLDNTPRGKELLLRTPMGRFVRAEERVGATV
jgi:hypothetical protein